MSRPGKPAARGFTMVELVLALALFALLAVFVLGIVNSVMGLWQSGERRGRGDVVMAAVFEQFQLDLHALHVGPRGWLELDTYEAVAEGGGEDRDEPAWRLPRLRFLARGSGLPGDDPTGRAPLEIAWVLVPEDAENSRLTRLIRIAAPETSTGTLRDDRVLRAMLRDGLGLTVLDGVAWAGFQAEEADGARVAARTVHPDQFFDFPVRLHLAVERVAGNSRRRPPVLDGEVGANPVLADLRGGAPFVMPEYALLEREWVKLTGNWPEPNLAARGERGTKPKPHAAGTVVYLPERYDGRFLVPAGGRRLP